MTGRRLTISEETYKALQAESLVRGKNPGVVLEELVMGGISPQAGEILITIGEPTAKADKPKSNKARLTDNRQALQTIRDLWRSGERNRAAIARQIEYPKATVAENIKKMLDSGEISEGED